MGGTSGSSRERWAWWAQLAVAYGLWSTGISPLILITMGVVAWNEESGSESDSSSAPRAAGPSSPYFVRLHLANPLASTDLSAVQFLVASPSPSARKSIAARIAVMDVVDRRSALAFVSLNYDSASPSWSARAFFDRLGGKSAFEVYTRKAVEAGEFPAVQRYLTDHKDPEGKAYLQRLFAGDEAAKIVLEL